MLIQSLACAQSHMRTLTRNVVPATGFAVSTLELLATTSGHEVPLPVYSSAMLQAVSPCSTCTTEHSILRSCSNGGDRKCTPHTSHENATVWILTSASGHQGIVCVRYLFDYNVGLDALGLISAFRLKLINHSMLLLSYSLTIVSQQYYTATLSDTSCDDNKVQHLCKHAM